MRSVSDAQVYELELAPTAGEYAFVPLAEAKDWEQPEPLDWPDEEDARPDLVPTCRKIIIEIDLLGRGSEKALQRRWDRAMAWTRRRHQGQLGSFEKFAEAVARMAMRRFFEQIGHRRLDEELRDQELRDEAFGSEEALLFYLEYARRWLTRLQQRSSRYRVLGEKDEDLIADTVTAILEIVRTGRFPLPFAKYEKAGLPACQVIYEGLRSKARRRGRITLVGRPMDLPTQAFPSPEDALLEREHQAELESFPARLAPKLTRTQRKWLDTFRNLAEQGWVTVGAAAWEHRAHPSQGKPGSGADRRHGPALQLLDGLEPAAASGKKSRR